MFTLFACLSFMALSTFRNCQQEGRRLRLQVLEERVVKLRQKHGALKFEKPDWPIQTIRKNQQWLRAGWIVGPIWIALTIVHAPLLAATSSNIVLLSSERALGTSLQ